MWYGSKSSLFVTTIKEVVSYTHSWVPTKVIKGRVCYTRVEYNRNEGNRLSTPVKIFTPQDPNGRLVKGKSFTTLALSPVSVTRGSHFFVARLTSTYSGL